MFITAGGVDVPRSTARSTSTVPLAVVPVELSCAYAAALPSSQAPAAKPATVRPRRIHRFIAYLPVRLGTPGRAPGSDRVNLRAGRLQSGRTAGRDGGPRGQRR